MRWYAFFMKHPLFLQNVKDHENLNFCNKQLIWGIM